VKALARLALWVSLLAGSLLAACAGERTPVQEPASAEAQATPRADGRAQLVRTLEQLKQPGVKAETDTQEARSVLDAIGGTPEMQGDGGLGDR
jgi:hypothetical protein